MIEFDDEIGRVVEVTVPPNLRDDPAIPAFRQQIEFIHATPLEYLERWIAASEVFENDVKLTSVVEWSDGRISFSISQPQCHGEPATHREIEVFFTAAGWQRIADDSGHLLFYNDAFEVLAIDALPRNCYIKDSNLLPFDVILCHPDALLQDFLKLY